MWHRLCMEVRGLCGFRSLLHQIQRSALWSLSRPIVCVRYLPYHMTEHLRERIWEHFGLCLRMVCHSKESIVTGVSGTCSVNRTQSVVESYIFIMAPSCPLPLKYQLLLPSLCLTCHLCRKTDISLNLTYKVMCTSFYLLCFRETRAVVKFSSFCLPYAQCPSSLLGIYKISPFFSHNDSLEGLPPHTMKQHSL